VQPAAHLARLLTRLAFIAPEPGAPPRTRRRPIARVSADGNINVTRGRADSLRVAAEAKA